jgi:pimeloyl-ACP methyl ester carboxylesterase
MELPDARLEVLEGCGHMPQEEAADESLQRFLRFLEETE